MSWYGKEQATPFDNQPIEGLHFLDGDIVAEVLKVRFVQGQKFPLVEFPSGAQCQIWESSDPTKMGIIHLFGEMDLPYKQSRNDAYNQAKEISEILGYVVKKVGSHQLELRGYEDDEHFLVTYHSALHYMENVEYVFASEKRRAKHPAHILMNKDIQAKLPPLRTNEEKGLEALAQVKYFHVTSNWTWYASEYDPEQQIFFGLVDGFETELGYFSLQELQEIDKAGHTLPVERDLHYDPKTLQELIDYHRKRRNE